MNMKSCLSVEKVSCYIIFLLISVVFIPLSTLNAQEAGNRFVILTDISGSMQRNDPHDLRKDALQFFIDTVSKAHPQNLEIAFYTFGETTYPHEPAASAFFNPFEHSDWLIEEISRIPRQDRYTDLKHSLETIYRQVSKSSFQGVTYLFLFTDAELTQDDVPEGVNLDRYKQQMYDAAADLGEENVKIYALAFSEKANLGYLQKLVSYTGGKAFQARRVYEANRTILELLEPIFKIPQAKIFNFDIDESIKSFTVYGFISEVDSPLPSIRVFDPHGKQVELEQKKYRTSISATCNEPEPGKWRAEVEGVKDSDVAYTYKPSFDVIYHRPKAKDFYVASGTPIDVDIELINVDNLNLKDFSARVSFETQGGQPKTYQLERDDRRFTGSITEFLPPGLYKMKTTIITSNGDGVNNEFMLTIGQPVDFDYTVQSDIGLNSPIIVSAIQPKEIEKIKDFTVLLTGPEGKEKEYELFDDGSADHSDEVAGDMKFTNRMDSFPKAGLYDVGITANGYREGVPVKTKKSTHILKAINAEVLEPEIIYPRSPEWVVHGGIRIENEIGYPVQVIDILPGDSENGVSAAFKTSDLLIEPNGEAEFEVEYRHSGTQPQESFTIPLNISCRVIGGEITEVSTVNLTQGFEIKPSGGDIFTRWLGVISVIIVILIILGPTLITSIRFGDKKLYIMGGEYTLIRQRKHLFDQPWLSYTSYVDFEDEQRVGITLLGYGWWKHQRSGQDDINHLKNIDIIH
ncbi:MAG: VWA domain-containing protein [Syntrophaceae bacterium]|nr:VWA domain-containing protein [Syntrophaceae bacterium]